MTFNQEVAWTINALSRLAIGGSWGVPRSGLIFTRTGETEATLTARMPLGGFATKIELEKYRQEDADCIARRITAGGWTFKDQTVNPNN